MSEKALKIQVNKDNDQYSNLAEERDSLIDEIKACQIPPSQRK